MRIRRSAYESLVDCPYTLKLYLDGIESGDNVHTIRGTNNHSKVEDAINNGEIPKSIQEFIDAVGISKSDIIFKSEVEKKYEVEIDGLIFELTADCVINSNSLHIIDWKFPMSEFTLSSYDYKIIQPYWYAYIIMTHYNVDKCTFYYMFPSFSYHIPFSIDIETAKKNFLIYVEEIKEAISNKENLKPKPTRCANCLYNKVCDMAFTGMKNIPGEITIESVQKLLSTDVNDANCSSLYITQKFFETMGKHIKEKLVDSFSKKWTQGSVDNKVLTCELTKAGNLSLKLVKEGSNG